MIKLLFIVFLIDFFLPISAQGFKVIRILPVPKEGVNQTVGLSNRDPITVIFDRPAITLTQALGVPIDPKDSPFLLPEDVLVPGVYTYISPEIARFEPTMDWPNDLVFKLVFQAISGPYGVLEKNTVFSFSFTTARISFQISSIVSSSALALTNNTWRFDISGKRIEEEFLLEAAPPGSVIEITFNYDIDINLVGSQIKLMNVDKNVTIDLPIPFENCSIPSLRCISLRPDLKDVVPDEDYELYLPEGTKTSQYSGKTTQKAYDGFRGLFGFKIVQLIDLPTLSNKQIFLYLRHGLKSDPEELMKNMTQSPFKYFAFEPNVYWTVSIPSVYEIIIQGDFAPSTVYTLTIYGNNDDFANYVWDGKNLGLEYSKIEFQMQDERSLLLSPVLSKITYFDNFVNDDKWVIFGRKLSLDSCPEPVKVRATNVKYNNIKEIIASLLSDQSLAGDITNSFNSTDGEIEFVPPFGNTNSFLYELWSCGGNRLSSIIMRTDYRISMLRSNYDIWIWITTMNDSFPINGGSLHLYTYNMNDPHPTITKLNDLPNYEVVKDGLVQIKLDQLKLDSDKICYIMINQGADIFISKPIALYKLPSKTYHSVITDRKFYFPGDTIFLKGYFRIKESEQVKIPPEFKGRINICWKDPNMTISSYDISLNAFGSYSAQIPIPPDCTLTPKTLTIYSDGNPLFHTTTTILLSETENPTAYLSIITNENTKYFKPKDSVSLTLSLNSSMGTPVQNAQVTIKWSIRNEIPRFLGDGYNYGMAALNTLNTELASGSTIVNLDSKGAWTGILAITDDSIFEGTIIVITAVYISPINEEIKNSIDLPISYSQNVLSFKPSVFGAIIPSYPFGIFTNVLDLNTGNSVVGTEIVINLYVWDGVTLPTIKPTGELNFDGWGSPVQSCKFNSGADVTIGCTSNSDPDESFSLPDYGQYILCGTIKDQKGYPFSTLVPIGQNLSQWQENPRTSHNVIDYILHQQDDKIKVEFYNPYPQSSLLLRWGNYPAITTEIIPSIPSGLFSRSYNLGTGCSSDCFLDLIQTVPNRNRNETLSPVPHTVLFDPYDPISFTRRLSINTFQTGNNIYVQIESSEVVSPGKQTEITVTLTDPTGKPTAGEVAVFVVLKDALVIKPNDITYFNDTLVNTLFENFYNHWVSNIDQVSYFGYQSITKTIRNRLKASQWYNPNYWPVHPENEKSSYDVSDQEYFSYYERYINPNPFLQTIPPWENNPQPVIDDEILGEIINSNPDNNPPSNSNGDPFLILDYFRAPSVFVDSKEVPESGKVVIPYTMPNRAGNYEIRVYAINKQSYFGVERKDQISSLDFALDPWGPIVVRTGDEFIAGVNLTVFKSNFDEEVSIEVFYTCQLLSLSSNPVFTAKPGANKKLTASFIFKAIGVGTGALIYQVKSLSLPDRIENDRVKLVIQSVYSHQDPIYIASSRKVGESDKTYIVPDAVQYSGNLTITAGWGKLPAIKTLSEMISPSVIKDVQADIHLARMMSYIALSNYSNNNLKAEFEAQFYHSLNQLQNYTTPETGLQLELEFMLPGPMTINAGTNMRLQAFGIWVGNKAKKILDLSQENKTKIDDMMSQWEEALLTEIDRQYDESSKEDNNFIFDYNSLSMVYLAYGLDIPRFTQEMLSLQNLIVNSGVLSSDSLAALVLHLLETDPQHEALDNLFSQLKTSLYSNNSTIAYFYDDGDITVPNLLACAIGLEAFLLKNETNNELLSFVSLIDYDNQPWWWMSGEQIAHYMLALATSDASLTYTNQISISAKDQKSGQVLFKSTFNSQNPSPTQNTYFFENIPQNITYEATGSLGEASIIYGAAFIPLEMPNEMNHGIEVVRLIQALDPKTNFPTGENLVGGNYGQIVVTTIQIYLRDFSSGVKIIDYFPGSMFPLVDTSEVPYNPQNSYLDWFYSGGAFSHKEFLQDRIFFYGHNLYPGTYTVRYYSLLLYTGTFTVPPAVAYDILSPQVMGRSKSGSFSLGSLESIVKKEVVGNQNCLPWENREIPMDKLNPYLGIFPEPTQEPEENIVGLAVGLTFLILILFVLVVGGLIYRNYYYKPHKEEMYTL